MGRAKAISGVIPLCSLTSVYFTLFFKQFQLTSKLWPKVREPYTLSNGSITLTKVTTGACTITHLLHVFPPNHLYLRDTYTSAGLHIDLGMDTMHSLFHFPWTTWTLLVNSNCNSLHYGPDKFISITISMEAQRLIYGLVFLPVRSPAH